ncbi:MAG: hypothetical protein ABR577_00220 [Pyrinomonadaceae bacterium]
MPVCGKHRQTPERGAIVTNRVPQLKKTSKGVWARKDGDFVNAAFRIALTCGLRRAHNPRVWFN